MIYAIGESTMQQFIRTQFNTDTFNKDLTALKTDMVREKRPVEKSDGGQKPEIDLQSKDNMISRNNLEDGKLVVEKYDADGKLVKVIPPGFLPFGERV